jgi:prevent-host-death family protein
MITEINAVTFRQSLGDMINQVQYRHDSIVITKDGKPVAALVDINLFQQYRQQTTALDRMADQMAEAFSSLPLKEGLARISAAVTQLSSSEVEE